MYVHIHGVYLKILLVFLEVRSKNCTVNFGFHTHLAVTFLKPSGTRFNVKNNYKPTADIIRSLVKPCVTAFQLVCLFTL